MQPTTQVRNVLTQKEDRTERNVFPESEPDWRIGKQIDIPKSDNFFNKIKNLLLNLRVKISRPPSLALTHSPHFSEFILLNT